jgi:hypothetical protein
MSNEKASKFCLMVGLQNSGKTSRLLEEYGEELDRAKSNPELKRPYFIDVELSVSDWLNNAEFIKYLDSLKEGINKQGIKLTNRVKIEYLGRYLADRYLYVDNAHRATMMKASMLKLLLSSCKGATITALDESQIGISLRDVILAEGPCKIRLKPPRKYLPTFDITPLLFGILVTAAFVTGNHSAAYILAGLATLSFKQSRAAKQS